VKVAISYQAYGLCLRSSFPLPGMRPEAAAELPSLTLSLRSAGELDSVWSGASGPARWRGVLGDGVSLTIEHGVEDDVLFAYGEQARFRLSPDMGRLDCAPSQASPDWQRALLGKVLPVVSLIRGYEALHAGVVDSPEGLVAIAGPSGAGKSTLATELLRRGWPLFADDTLTLESEDGTVRAHPGTPHMNLDLSHPEAIEPRAVGRTLHILAGERWLTAHATVAHPRPVRMICLLERGPSLALESRHLASSPLLLAPYMLSLSNDAERERSRFCLYADLMESTSLVRLTAGYEHRPTQLADELERALAQSAAALAEGVA
jgi:hypothetical protein